MNLPMSAAGTWHLVIDTPIGRQHADVVLTRNADGTWEGRADAIPLTDVVVDGAEVRWRQSITRPLRLNLAFTLTVDGDTITGQARAGRLPASTVTGTRSEVAGR